MENFTEGMEDKYICQISGVYTSGCSWKFIQAEVLYWCFLVVALLYGCVIGWNDWAKGEITEEFIQLKSEPLVCVHLFMLWGL